MHSYLSNVGFNRNPSRKAGFNEKPRFLEHLKKPEVGPIYIGSYPLARAQFTLPAHFGKIKQSHTDLGFLFLLLLFFCFFVFFFPYFVFACTFFTLHFVKHKENQPKLNKQSDSIRAKLFT